MSAPERAAEPEVDVPVTTEADDVPAPPAVHPRRLLGRYEIIAEIAKGGMGTVYLARLEGAGGFERLMAVKLMHEHLAEDDAFVTMLLDEARTAANIHHPNAVGITDVAESPLGHYLVMDYVDGFPLSHVITHPDLVTRDRIRIGMRLLADAAHGLHAAHTAKNAKGEKLGIVHRDVSPQNVLVGTDGMGRIVDFGIALAASRVAASRPGSLKGKPQYMAPEQAKGEPCDARTDVFALGVIAWEILTYERLFFGEMDVAILVQVMECNVPSPLERDPNLPRALADATMKALARQKEDRFATARDFAVAIERAAEAAGMLATSHEVEELLARILADEIEAKNAAVHLHLSRSGGPAVPMRKGELSLVSRLFERGKLVHKPRAEMSTRAGLPGGGTPDSGVRGRSRPEIELAATATNTPAVHAVMTPTGLAPADWTGRVPTGAEQAGVERPPSRTRVGALGAALGALGIVAILLALWLVFLRAPGASEPAPTASSPTTPAASAPSASPMPETLVAPLAGAPVEPALDAVPEAASAPAPVEAPIATPAPAHGGGTHGRGRGHGATEAPTAAPTEAATEAARETPPAPTTSGSTAGTTPTLEANPYH